MKRSEIPRDSGAVVDPETTWVLEGWVDPQNAIGGRGYWERLREENGGRMVAYGDYPSALGDFQRYESRWPSGCFRIVRVERTVVALNDVPCSAPTMLER